MKITYETTIGNFKAWGNAVRTLATIEYYNKMEDFEKFCEEFFFGEVNETQLNDFLSFEADYIFDILGIEEDED